MKKQDLSAEILVKASAIKAFESINQVTAWWTENVEGSTEKLGDVFTLLWGDSFVRMKIVESVPGKKVVWNVIDCDLTWLKDRKEWKGTQVVFELSAEGNSTRIHFTHIGLVPQVECYDSCVQGWNQYFVDSLTRLINQGKGLPQRKAVATAKN